MTNNILNEEDCSSSITEFEKCMMSKKLVLDTLSDSITGLLYYDRKEDEYLPLGAIEGCIVAGEITVEEMVDHFDKVLRNALEDYD